MKISATIITLNNASHIERTLKSLSFCDEIIVVDSHSTDGTQDICSRHGAKVFENDFKNYGHQKNYAAKLASHDWILNVDSDEVVSEELQKSIKSSIQNDEETGLYKISRLNYFCGKPLRYGGWFPDIIPRLYKRSEASWTEPHVHEYLVAHDKNKKAGEVKGLLHHYSFPDLDSHIQTNLRYAKQSAESYLEKKPNGPSLLAILIRPPFKFFELYIIKLGFLDGFYGFVQAVNSWHAVFLRYIFARQMRNKK